MTIAQVGPEAAALLAALHADATPASAWTEPAFRDLLAMPGALALASAHGFALLRVAVDEAEVIMLAVRQAARREGHGRALLQAGLAEARRLGAARLFLEVAADNTAARALYNAQGFVPVGRRPLYYGATDAVVLALTLSS